MYHINNYDFTLINNGDSIYIQCYDITNSNSYSRIIDKNVLFKEVRYVSTLDILYDRLKKMLGQNTQSFKSIELDFNININILNEQMIIDFDIYYNTLHTYNKKFDTVIYNEKFDIVMSKE